MTMAPNNQIVSIEFLQDHLPVILPGKYRSYAGQVVGSDELTGISRTNFVTPTMGGLAQAQYFYVSGPRFKVNPGLIQTVYPPNDGNGNYDGNLPTLFLTRSTLPWERRPNYQKATDTFSWLALLLFDESDFQQGNVKVDSITLGKFPFDPASGATDDLEYDPTIRVDVITINQAADILPAEKDLQWMAHGRIPYIKNGNGTIPEDEIAVVLANRLPTPGKKNTVFLVSMESYYDQFASGALPPAAPGTISLLTLYRWQFVCKPIPKAQKEGTFESYLQNVSSQALALNRTTSNNDGQLLIQQGHVPLIHWLRNGGHTVSWYRGALAPGPVPDQKLPLTTGTSSDSFLIFDSKTGMFNASYATAWETGRQMGIENVSFSREIFDFKNTLQQAIITEKQNKSLGNYSNLLANQLNNTPTLSQQLLQIVAEWKLLYHLPFSSLIGNPEMLPDESIRFFSVDGNWMNTFLSGAFSLGYFPELISPPDFAHLMMDITKPVTGLLLRSQAVKGWPHLQVDAYHNRLSITDTAVNDPVQQGILISKTDIDDAITALNKFEVPVSITALIKGGVPLTVFPIDPFRWWLVDYGNNRYFMAHQVSAGLDVSEYFTLPVLRMEKLADSVLLVLFADSPETIDFHLKPGPLHSGFELNAGAYEKVLRDPLTGIEYKTNPVPVIPNKGSFSNVLSMDKIATNIWNAMKGQGYTGPMTAAEYGLEMIEGAPKVRFNVS